MSMGMGMQMGGFPQFGGMAQGLGNNGSMTRPWGWGPSLRAGQMAAENNPNPVQQLNPHQPVKADVAGIEQARQKIAAAQVKAQLYLGLEPKTASATTPGGTEPGAKTTPGSMFGNTLGGFGANTPGSAPGRGTSKPLSRSTPASPATPGPGAPGPGTRGLGRFVRPVRPIAT